MSVVTITPPASLSVSVEEAKAQMVVTESDDDVLISRLIKVAEGMAEQLLGGYVSSQTVEHRFSAFPSGDIFLTSFPVQSVTSLTYVDDQGVTHTLTEGTDFRSDLSGKASRIIPLSGWFATQENTPDAVKVRLLVGYTSAPEDIRHAILLKVAELYERREESIVGLSVSPSYNTFKTLLKMHRRHVL